MATISVCELVGIVALDDTDHYTAGGLVATKGIIEASMDTSIEAFGWHINGFNQVSISISDNAGATSTSAGDNVVTKTVSGFSASQYIPQQVGWTCGVFAATFTAAEWASLDDGEVTITITFTPTSGTARTVTYTVLNNAGGSLTKTIVYADPATGTDSTGTTGTSGDPYATACYAAGRAAEAYSGGDPTDRWVEVRCKGDHEMVRIGASPYANTPTYITFTLWEGEAIGNVTFYNHTRAAGADTRARFLHFRGVTIDIADSGGTSSYALLAGFTSWSDDSVWVENCIITHSSGRSGHETIASGATKWIADQNYAGDLWVTGSTVGNWNQDAIPFPCFARDNAIGDVSADIFDNPKVAFQNTCDDNFIDPSIIPVSSTTGATATTGYIKGNTSGVYARITAIRSGQAVVIDTGDAVFADFDADESVSNGMTFYPSEADAIAETNAAGTATHNPTHPDFVQFEGSGPGDDNSVIAYNFFTGDGQGMFIKEDRSNILFAYNWFYSQNDAFRSQAGNPSATHEHLMYIGNSFPNQEFLWRTDSGLTFSDCLFAHNVCQDVWGQCGTTDGTSNGITLDNNWAMDPSANYTTGRSADGASEFVNGPDYEDFGEIVSPDFHPASTNDLPAIPMGELYATVTIDGQTITDDGSAVVGAYPLEEAAASSSGGEGVSTTYLRHVNRDLLKQRLLHDDYCYGFIIGDSQSSQRAAARIPDAIVKAWTGIGPWFLKGGPAGSASTGTGINDPFLRDDTASVSQYRRTGESIATGGTSIWPHDTYEIRFNGNPASNWWDFEMRDADEYTPADYENTDWYNGVAFRSLWYADVPNGSVDDFTVYARRNGTNQQNTSVSLGGSYNDIFATTDIGLDDDDGSLNPPQCRVRQTSAPDDETNEYMHCLGGFFYRHDGTAASVGDPVGRFGLVSGGQPGLATEDFSGLTAANWENYLDLLDVGTRNPNLYIIMLGHNDASQETTKSTYKTRIASIIADIKSAHTSLGWDAPVFMLIGPWQRTFGTNNTTRQALIKEYALAMQELAQNDDTVGYIGIGAATNFTLFSNRLDEGGDGQIHPSTQEDAIWFMQQLWRFIKPTTVSVRNASRFRGAVPRYPLQ